jgi:mevalonate kinase
MIREEELLDEVQLFIARNSHQFGYIMQEASRQWIKKDPVGALTVGDCNFVVQKYGQYHELLEESKRLREALERIKEKCKDAGAYTLAAEVYHIAHGELKRGGD